MKIYSLHINVSDTVKPEEVIRKIVDEAKNKKSSLFVLPELFLSSYIDIYFFNLVTLKKILGPLLSVSSSNNIAFVGSVPLKYDNRKYNTAILIVNGEIEILYNKRHLYMHEKEFFDKGELSVGFFDYKDFKFAVQVCLDVMDICYFKQKVVSDNVQLLLMPMATSSNALNPIIKSRSIELQIPIITSNRFGNDKGILFNIPSTIFMPDGTIRQDTLNLKDLDFDFYYKMRNKLDIIE